MLMKSTSESTFDKIVMSLRLLEAVNQVNTKCTPVSLHQP